MKKVLLLAAVAVLLTGCSLTEKPGNEQASGVNEQKDYSCSSALVVNEEERVKEIVLTCPEGDEVIASGGTIKTADISKEEFAFSEETKVHYDRFVTFEKSGWLMRMLLLYDRTNKETYPFIASDFYGFLNDAKVFYACANDLPTRANYCRVYKTDNLKRPYIIREKFISSYKLDEEENLVIEYTKPGAEEVEIEKIDLKAMY